MNLHRTAETEAEEFVRAAYLRTKKVWGARRLKGLIAEDDDDTGKQPFSAGRDPRWLAGVIDGLTKQLGWEVELSKALLFEKWPEIVGAELARHSQIVDLRGGVLRVQCDDHSWTTQLRLERNSFIGVINREFPHAGVTDVKFLAPATPSWRHGRYHVKGRGPRDTYN